MDDAAARQVLRDHGETPPARGRLTGEWRAKATHYADQDAGLTTGPDDPGDPGPEYGGHVTEADFGGAALDEAPDPADTDLDEQKPRRPAAKTGGGLLGALKSGRKTRTGSGSARPKAKATHPRVPVDRLVSRGWEMLAGLAGRIDPPLGRCLDMQAPIAGLILEDVVRGTMVDRALQPVARAEERAEKVVALAAPPMIVLGLEAAQALPDDQRKVREAILLPMLQESLVLWVKIAGDKIEARAAREAEEGPARQKAQELIAMIFAPPPTPPATPDPEMAGAAA